MYQPEREYLCFGVKHWDDHLATNCRRCYTILASIAQVTDTVQHRSILESKKPSKCSVFITAISEQYPGVRRAEPAFYTAVGKCSKFWQKTDSAK
jgi:hypothetical protein